METLSDVRVVEFATNIAGPYAGKLLADAGADVVKVETSTGDPLRTRAVHDENLNGRDAALFRFLNGAKRSVVGSPGDDEIEELLAGADLVIESFVPQQLDIERLRSRFPALVITSVTPYGRGGDWETRPTSEFIVQAESGGTGQRGEPADPPVQAGGRLSEWVTGTYTGVASLAAVLHARRSGQGETIDVSQLEATTLTYTCFGYLAREFMGMPLIGPARRVERPSVEPTLDGYVGFNTNTRPMFENFLIMIERPDLIEDGKFTMHAGRVEHAAEWDEIVRSWTRTKTTQEIVELATMLRIPVAPVMDPSLLPEHEQFKARGFYVSSPDGDFLQPLPPYSINGQRPMPRGPAPTLGQNTGNIEVRERPAPTAPSEASALPLAGLRILDATAWWAGPSATQQLAYLGAEVIHLESVTRPDGSRTAGVPHNLDQWWELSALFVGCNTNKAGVTLGLDDPRGLELVRELIKHCDAVVENFSPRVFDQYGLTWEAIHELNPRTIFMRMPGFGTDGPWRDNVGFAQTMEQMSGMAWMTGFRDGPPRIPLGPCDPNAGTHATFALLVALAEREKTGLGSYIEATMVEAALNAAAEITIVASAYGQTMMRDGNRGPDAAPQGLYSCAGTEEWLALSIVTDVEWNSLVEVLGRPEWALAEALAGSVGRRSAHDEIDARLSAWASEQDCGAVVDRLLNAGVPAARVADPRLIHQHPRHVERGWFETVEHALAGEILLPGPPYTYVSIDRWSRSPAPLLGEHSQQVLTGLLGLDPSEVADLEAASVTGRTVGGARVAAKTT